MHGDRAILLGIEDLRREGGRVPVVCRTLTRSWCVSCNCTVLVFSSLLLVYLKSAEIVSAGSPEVKPAEAHGSDALLCTEVVL